MPISQINPNGTVKIINSKTGQMLDVPPQDLPKYNPKLVADYQARLQEQQKQEQAASESAKALSSGALKLSDIPADQRVKAVNLIAKEGKSIPQTTSAEDNKKKNALDSTTNFINNLEKHFTESGAGNTNLGPLTRVLGFINSRQADIGLNPEAQLYNKERAGFAATLKSLTGDTGVLTDQDFARLQQLLPGLGSTKKESQGLLNDLRSQIAAKYGGEPTKTSFDPKEKNLIQTVLPATSKFTEEIGQQRSLPPEQREEVAKNYATNNNPISFLYNLASGQKEAKSLVKPTEELAGGVMALEGLGSLGKFLNPKKVAGKVFTQNAGSSLRNEVVSQATQAGKKIEGENLASAVTDWGEKAIKANPGKDKQITKIVDGAINSFSGKKVSPEEAFNIWKEVDSGFNQAGITKSSVEASADRAIRDALRKELDSVAPGFEEGTKQIAQGLKRSKIASKLAWAGAGAIPGAVTTTALFSAMDRLKGK